MKKIYINPFVILILVFSYFGNRLPEYLIIFFTAIIHECFHMIAGIILGYKVYAFKIMPFGVCLEIDSNFKNNNDELIISAFGPLSNMLMLIFCILIKYFFNIDTGFYAYTNMYMMLLNLIPAFPLDGGRIFNYIIKDVFFDDHKKIYRTLNIFSSFFVFILGICLTFKTKENFSLLLAGLFMINNTKFKYYKSERICDLIYNKKNFYKPELLALSINMKICESLKYIKMDKFIIIYLLDDNKKILGVVTNAEILNLATQDKGSFKLAELIKERTQ